MSSSAGKVRSASSIAFSGSESPTRDSTSSVGAASASSSARSVASVRASSSAFVSQSSREMSEAGAMTKHLYVLARVGADRLAQIGRWDGGSGDDEKSTRHSFQTICAPLLLSSSSPRAPIVA